MFQSTIVTVFNIVWLFSKVWSVIILSSAFVIIQNFLSFRSEAKTRKFRSLISSFSNFCGNRTFSRENMKKFMNDVLNCETSSQISMKDSGIGCENLDENDKPDGILNSTSVSEVTTIPDETPLGNASNQSGKEN